MCAWLHRCYKPPHTSYTLPTDKRTARLVAGKVPITTITPELPSSYSTVLLSIPRVRGVHAAGHRAGWAGFIFEGLVCSHQVRGTACVEFGFEKPRVPADKLLTPDHVHIYVAHDY